MYFEGRGVSKSDQGASVWYRKPAYQEQADAQRDMGVFYEHAIPGLPNNTASALPWHQKAAAQGNKEALESVDELEATSPPTKRTANGAANCDAECAVI